MAQFRDDGGQIDIESLNNVKENYNQLELSQTTSDDAYRRRLKEAREQQIEAWLAIAGLGGAAYGTAILVNRNPELADFIAKLPGANRYAKKHELAQAYINAKGYKPTDLTDHFKSQTFGRSVLSFISSLEELSPFGIGKTLQTSNILEPLVGISRDIKDIHIPGTSVKGSEDYMEAVIRQASGGKQQLEAIDYKKGLVVRDNLLLRYNLDGSLDEANPILKHARAITTHTKMGDSLSPNRPYMKFAALHNTSLGFNSFDKEQISFIAGSSWTDLTKKWASSIFMQGMEIGYKTMDKPLAGIEDLARAAGVGSTGLFENETYKKLRDKISPNLGTKGQYNLTPLKGMGVFTQNMSTKLLTGYVGYQAVNQVLSMITPESSAWNDGIISGITANYANLRVQSAKILADPFQRYKEAQENAADGSTSLMTLAGFPMVGAVAGAKLPYFKRMYESATMGIEKASQISDAKVHGYGMFDSLAEKMKLGKTNQSKAYGFVGAVIGATLALPFLPGALIGESSEELKESYSGRKLEANRANANWLAGGSSWEGEHIKNFQPGRVARILSDARDEVLYNGDDDLKRDLDPIYSPIRYLRNPYAFEEMHQHDMPYPVWGMNVEIGSFVGKAYQGTIGEIIKPSIINPAFDTDSRLLNQDTLKTHRNQFGYDAGGGPSDNLYQGASSFSIQTALAQMGGTNSNANSPILFSTKSNERKMIDAGMMLPEESPYSDPHRVALSQTYNSLVDFTGLKGFMSGLVVNDLGYTPETVRRQLASSGDARSLSRDILNENIGDIFGLGEVQRRLIPTSASSRVDDVNPMLNSVAPTWLPANEEKYYKDFSKGDYWNKVSLGEHRLPGAGYAKYNPELEGVDPEKYPLVHQYKILSDVAMGSPEQIAMKEFLLTADKEGALSDKERDIFFETLTQDQAKSQRKQFSEYKTDEEYGRLSITGKLMNSMWETVTHNAESPLEPLTPFRPGAKFIHKRTAIEDYEKTMLQGPDTAIWTNPYSHFIKPAFNRTMDTVIPGTKRPEEAIERDNVEEYFDKLEYLKARMNGRPNDVMRTVHGATASGILDEASFNKFSSGLSNKQRDYLQSFAKEEDIADRKKILSMLPTDVAEGYKTIWNNLSIAERAKANGDNVKEALEDNYIKGSIKYLAKSKFYNEDLAVELNQAIKDDKRQKAMSGANSHFSEHSELIAKARELRLRQADEEAMQYVAARTGVPDSEWIGWDPRLKLDEIKLRTLKIGKADTYDYGFWDSDLQRNSRIIALDTEDQVTRSFNDIKSTMRADNVRRMSIENGLFENGIFARRVTLSEASSSDFTMRMVDEQ